MKFKSLNLYTNLRPLVLRQKLIRVCAKVFHEKTTSIIYDVLCSHIPESFKVEISKEYPNSLFARIKEELMLAFTTSTLSFKNTEGFEEVIRKAIVEYENRKDIEKPASKPTIFTIAILHETGVMNALPGSIVDSGRTAAIIDMAMKSHERWLFMGDQPLHTYNHILLSNKANHNGQLVGTVAFNDSSASSKLVGYGDVTFVPDHYSDFVTVADFMCEDLLLGKTEGDSEESLRDVQFWSHMTEFSDPSTSLTIGQDELTDINKDLADELIKDAEEREMLLDTDVN